MNPFEKPERINNFFDCVLNKLNENKENGGRICSALKNYNSKTRSKSKGNQHVHFAEKLN